MKLVSQDRDLSVEVYGDEDYWYEEIMFYDKYFGTGLYMSTDKNDRLYLGFFEDEEQTRQEITIIQDCFNFGVKAYMIRTPDLLV